MPFVEHARTVYFSSIQDIPLIKITFTDGTKQDWKWDPVMEEWDSDEPK